MERVELHTQAAPLRGTVFVQKSATCRNCGRPIKMDYRGGNDEHAAKWIHYVTRAEECGAS